jgi:hypothetical protein
LWAWGANSSSADTSPVGLTDDAGDVALSPGFLWANAATCTDPLTGTAVLIESQSLDTGGRYALVVSSQVEGVVDRLQIGGEQSVATALPTPVVDGFATGSDDFGPYTDFQFTWPTPTGTAWAVSDVPTVLAGFRLWFTAGASVLTGDQTQFAPLGTTPGTAPFVIDDPDADDGLLPATANATTVRVRPGTATFIALSLLVDGTGATSGDPQADASAVETSVVSAPTEATADGSFLFADGFESGNTTVWSGSS